MVITKFLGLFILSATKYFAAVLLLLADKSISPIEMFAILIIGGVIGVFGFYFFGKVINMLVDKFLLLWKKELVIKKRFTKKNRRLVKVKTKYGLIGISVITPIILSIPIGCFLARRFYSNEKKTLPMMLLGVLSWTVVFTTVKMILS